MEESFCGVVVVMIKLAKISQIICLNHKINYCEKEKLSLARSLKEYRLGMIYIHRTRINKLKWVIKIEENKILLAAPIKY